MKFFIYYKVLLPLGLLIGAVTIKSSGMELTAVDRSDQQVVDHNNGRIVGSFLLLNLFPAALIASVGIVLSWSLAPTLYFSALGFGASLVVSTVLIVLTIIEYARAMRSFKHQQQKELLDIGYRSC